MSRSSSLFVVTVLLSGLACTSAPADVDRLQQATTASSACRSDRLTPVSATASSVEQSAFATPFVIDGKTSTRWSSQFSDPQWVYVDLGARKRVDRVVLRWETAASSDYELRVSDDETTWRTLYRDANGDGGVDTIAGLGVTARYVMMYSNHRKTQYGVSLWELEVYGDANTSCAGCADRALALDQSGNSGGWTNLNAATDGIAGPGATAATKATTGTEYVEYWLTGETPISRARLWDDNLSSGGVNRWNVQYWNGTAFVDAFPLTDTPGAGWNEVSFTQVATSRVRVQMQHTARVSVREIEIFGCQAQPGCAGTRLVPVSATASSVENSGTTAAMAIDGSSSTRWSSQFSDPQWIYVDLGARRRVDRVVLRWENAASASYELRVSDDAQTWKTVYVDASGNGGVDDITGLHATARYVKLWSSTRTTSYGVSLWELEIYGSTSLDCGGCTEKAAALQLVGSSGGWTDTAAVTDGVIGPSATPATKVTTGIEYLEYKLAQPISLTRARLWEDNGGTWNVDDWNVQYWNGTAFVDAFPLTDTPVVGWNEVTFVPVQTDRVRVRMRDGAKLEVREIQLFGCPPAVCSMHEFDAPAGTCAGTTLKVVGHSGITRAIFEGQELPGTGKHAAPVEKLDFTFNQAVSAERAASAVQIISTSCPAAVLPASCTHEVQLEMSYADASHTVLRVENPNDPFLPGCRYELRINTGQLSAAGQCLATPVKLRFQSAAAGEGASLNLDTDDRRFQPQDGAPASFKLKKSVFWKADELFQHRVAALGLRPGVDSFVAGRAARQSSYGPDTESVHFRQAVGGYPLLDGGYVAQRDRVTGRVLQVTGRSIKNVPMPTAPTISVAAARVSALTEVNNQPVTNPPPELGLVQDQRDGSHAYKLAYRFSLSSSDARVGRLVDVDAHTGAVLASANQVVPACPSVDVSTLVEPDPPWTTRPVVVDTRQSALGHNDPVTLGVTAYSTAAGAPVFPLDTRGGAPVPGVALGRPSIYTQCPGETFPKVVRLPGNDSDLAWPVEPLVAAQLHLAAQGCVDYFAARPRPFGAGGAQWSGYDGSGLASVSIQLDPSMPSDNAFFANKSPGFNPVMIFSPEFIFGAPLDIVCHEFAHGIFYNWGFAASTDPEVVALNEAVGDMFGGAVEFASRKNLADLWCAVENPVTGACSRYLNNPAASRAPQPQVYKGTNWCDGDQCEPHLNAGVPSYWFYLIVSGVSQDDPGACGQAVPALDPSSVEKSIDLATEIVFTALRDHYAPGGQLRDFANATITAARTISASLGRDDELAKTVAAAWHAVNVWDRPFDEADWYPASNTFNFGPWDIFNWREDSTATLAEYQVDLLPTFDTHNGGPAFHAGLITQFSDKLPDGRPVPGGGTINLASTVYSLGFGLEPNTTYFWRTRPAAFGADPPWGACEIVHSFMTGPAPAVDEVSSPREGEEVKPGDLEIHFVSPGLRYRVQVADHDVDCKMGQASEEQLVEQPTKRETPDPFVPYRPPVTATLHDLQPETEYWLEILPIGPPNSEGQPSVGACFKRRFKTLAVETPSDLGYMEGSSLDYFGPGPKLTWKGYAGTAKYQLQFFDIQDEVADQKCSSTAAATAVVELPCAQGSCPASFDTKDQLPAKRNLSGYCWQVRSISANGHSTEPGSGSFRYFVRKPLQQSPGTFERVVVVPGDSYGKPVRLGWSPVEGAIDYVVRVGTRPWSASDMHVPANQGTEAVAREGLTASTPFKTREPADETLQEVTNETELELAADAAAGGTLCWTVWPEMADLRDSSKKSKRQPLVDLGDPYCFSVGPSEPKIVFDQPKSGSAKPGDTIAGRITVAFTPNSPLVDVPFKNGQALFNLDYTGCQPDGYRWDPNDPGVAATAYRDCVIAFQGVAQEGDETSYEIRVRVGPWDKRGSIVIDGCGAPGQICCTTGDYCKQAKTTCAQTGSKNTCVPCGDPGLRCCVVNHSAVICNDQSQYICGNAGTCEHCGMPGEPCCLQRPECRNASCGDDFMCPGASSCPSLASVEITAPAGPLGPVRRDWNALYVCVPETQQNLLGHGRIISWKPVPGATAYHVYDVWGNFSYTTTDTSFVLDTHGEYCGATGILVYAVNACGSVSPDSATNGTAFIYE
jgi:hypothetical protein